MKMILFLGVVLASAVGFALDITTLDGKTYKNVIVISANPVALNIGYQTKDKVDVIKGIPFTNLPEDIRKKYGYTKEKADKFISKTKAYEKKEITEARKFAVENAKMQKEINQDALIYDNLRAMLYSKRLANIKLSIVRQVKNGSVARCTTELPSVTTGHLGKVYVIGLQGGQGASWWGSIYPTGNKVTFEDGIYPVYTTTIDTAISIILKDIKEKDLSKAVKKDVQELSR